jgi:NAD(P)-dependent dehydrogenase (short-subunit alcohol dehydrogenase family)
VRGSSSSIAYGTSKAGVHGMVMTLQPRLEPQGIRVHAICPGSIDTVLKRENVADGARVAGRDVPLALASASLGAPEGVAKVLAFLASDDADYVRGTVFTR